MIGAMTEWFIPALAAAVLGGGAAIVAVARAHRAVRAAGDENARLRAELDRFLKGQTFGRVGTWDWTVDTDTLHWSDDVFAMFGFAPGEVAPTYSLFCSMVHPDDAPKVRQGEIACAAGEAPHDEEYRVVWRDGTVRWLRETGNAVIDVAGRPVRMIGIVRDITDEKAHEQRILHLAYHDALTGLPNRVYFRSRLEDALARARRHGSLVALAFIDLDRFKPINDRHGHHVGDAVLVQVAARLRGSVRATDCVARLGGDEFVAVLEDVHGADEVPPLAHKLMDAIAAPLEAEGLRLDVGASIGVSVFPTQAGTPDELIAGADQAMYEAKRAGIGLRLCPRTAA